MSFAFRRTDETQGAIVSHLRRAGWFVYVTTGLKQGFPDLLVSCGGFAGMVEVKRGAAKLTLDEEKFSAEYTGPYIVGRTPEQTLKDLERARAEVMG